MISTRILEGGEITYNEAAMLGKAEGSNIILLCSFANKIRERFNENHVDLCKDLKFDF